jgi:hypothetical protein
MMTPRLSTILALLLAGAAIAATPALAASLTTGNTGPAQPPVNRAAPITLPGAVSPRPTPFVSGEVSRGLFHLTPEAALAGLATVSLSNSGEITETPASDALRAAFENEIKGSQGD